MAAVVTDLKSILQEPEKEPAVEESVAEISEPMVEISEPVVEEPSVEEPVIETLEQEVQLEDVQAGETKAEVTQTEEPVRKKGALLKALIVVLSIIFVLLLAYAIVGRVAPDFVDSFLYTPEELKILNHKL